MLASVVILSILFVVQFFSRNKSLGDLNMNLLSKDRNYKEDYLYIILSSITIIGVIVYIVLSNKTLESMFITIPSFSTEEFSGWVLIIIGLFYTIIVGVTSFMLFISNKMTDSGNMSISINKTELKTEKDKEDLIRTISILKDNKENLIERLLKFEKIITVKLILRFISYNLIFIFILDLVLYQLENISLFLSILMISLIMAVFNLRKFSILNFIINTVSLSMYVILTLSSGSIIFYTIVSLLLLMITQNVISMLKQTIEHKDKLTDNLESLLNEYEEKQLNNQKDAS